MLEKVEYLEADGAEYDARQEHPLPFTAGEEPPAEGEQE